MRIFRPNGVQMAPNELMHCVVIFDVEGHLHIKLPRGDTVSFLLDGEMVDCLHVAPPGALDEFRAYEILQFGLLLGQGDYKASKIRHADGEIARFLISSTAAKADIQGRSRRKDMRPVLEFIDRHFRDGQTLTTRRLCYRLVKDDVIESEEWTMYYRRALIEDGVLVLHEERPGTNGHLFRIDKEALAFQLIKTLS